MFFKVSQDLQGLSGPLLSYSNENLLKYKIEKFVEHNGFNNIIIDPDHLEFTVDAVNSKIHVKAKDLTEDGLPGLYVGEGEFTYLKGNVEDVLHGPLFLAAHLNKPYGQFLKELFDFTGIVIEPDEVTWSDGINTFTPTNTSLHLPLIPNAANNYMLSATFNNLSHRYNAGSQIQFRFFNLDGPKNISYLSTLNPDTGLYNEYNIPNLDSLVNYLFYHDIKDASQWSRYNNLDAERNIMSSTGRQIVFDIYYLYTGIQLEQQYLDIIVDSIDGIMVNARMVPNGLINNPYMGEMPFHWKRTRLSANYIETFYIRTISSLSYEHLKNYLWTRHQMLIEDGEFRIEFDNTFYVLEPGTTIPLMGYTGSLKMQAINSWRFVTYPELNPVELDLYFVP